MLSTEMAAAHDIVRIWATAKCGKQDWAAVITTLHLSPLCYQPLVGPICSCADIEALLGLCSQLWRAGALHALAAAHTNSAAQASMLALLQQAGLGALAVATGGAEGGAAAALASGILGGNSQLLAAAMQSLVLAGGASAASGTSVLSVPSSSLSQQPSTQQLQQLVQLAGLQATAASEAKPAGGTAAVVAPLLVGGGMVDGSHGDSTYRQSVDLQSDYKPPLAANQLLELLRAGNASAGSLPLGGAPKGSGGSDQPTVASPPEGGSGDGSAGAAHPPPASAFAAAAQVVAEAKVEEEEGNAQVSKKRRGGDAAPARSDGSPSPAADARRAASLPLRLPSARGASSSLPLPAKDEIWQKAGGMPPPPTLRSDPAPGPPAQTAAA